MGWPSVRDGFGFQKACARVCLDRFSFPGIQTEFSPRFDYEDRGSENELWMGGAGMRVGVRHAESIGYGSQGICAGL